MCAIAHFLEEEGIATTLIALIRLHAEKARPPRALWVPFQLGRPVGAPLQASFQRKLIRAALGLLETNAAAPLLEDFPEDEPGSANVDGWRPPIVLDAKTLEAELALLKPWYQKSRQRTGRTTVGVVGVGIETAARYLLAIDSASPLPKPRKDLAEVQCLRYAVDDLKAYYLEAITAAGDAPSGWQLAHWFWEETLAGQLVRDLQRNSFEHLDAQRRYATWWLVPDGFSERATVERIRKIKSPS